MVEQPHANGAGVAHEAPDAAAAGAPAEKAEVEREGEEAAGAQANGAARRRALRSRSAEDTTAAELLLGFGSADSEGGSPGSSSGRQHQQQAKRSGGAGKAARVPAGKAVRRSMRQTRQPAKARASSELASAGLSDDEFEPTPPAAKHAPKARAPAPAAAPVKSELTVLCERFQQQFGYLHPDGTPNALVLTSVAEALGVPRRRLYDVINVFESIEVMRRVGKLQYEWVGFDHLPTLMEQLAEEEEQGTPVEDRIRRAPAASPASEGGEGGGDAKGNSHSLWVLSRRLVRMLLKSTGPIALTAAAAVLVGPGGVSDPSQHRSQTQITVERRLYDIGSILCSVGLIERIYLKKRQPAFEWIYGWKPGQAGKPPKMPNNIGPAQLPPGEVQPPIRKRAASRPSAQAAPAAGGGGADAAKRQKTASEAVAEAAAATATGAMPFGAVPFGMPLAGMAPFGTTAGGGMASPAMMAAMGLSGMSPPGDGKEGAGLASMPMMFPSFFNMAAMAASANPSPEAGSEGAGAAGTASGEANGAAPSTATGAAANGAAGAVAAAADGKTPSPAAGMAGMWPGMAGMQMQMMGMPASMAASMASMMWPGMQLPMMSPDGAGAAAAGDGKANGAAANGVNGSTAGVPPFQYPMLVPLLVPVPHSVAAAAAATEQQQEREERERPLKGDLQGQALRAEEGTGEGGGASDSGAGEEGES